MPRRAGTAPQNVGLLRKTVTKSGSKLLTRLRLSRRLMLDGELHWDDRKAAENHAKHAITCEMARDVFNDPFAVEWPDDGQDAGEQRFAVLGMVEDRLLFVACTLRGGTIRIISARRAVTFERRKYHDENQA